MDCNCAVGVALTSGVLMSAGYGDVPVSLLLLKGEWIIFLSPINITAKNAAPIVPIKRNTSRHSFE